MTSDAGMGLDVDDLRVLVEDALARVWGNAAGTPVAQLRDHPSLVGLADAIEYSLLAPGKRVRPVLVLAAAEACGARPAPDLADVAAAFECVHAYSLVHDDLPSMDDDDLRRGMPTSHRRFGEGVAVLVGDALQAAAYALIAGGGREVVPSAAQRLEVVRLLADASGWAGMVGGQYLDVRAGHAADDVDALRELHALKTGALIAASVEAGAVLGGADAGTRAGFRSFGEGLGWLFQLVDDLLDEVGDEQATGKAVGSDRRLAKVTAVGVLGMDGLRAAADEQLARCLDLARGLPAHGGRLAAIARYVRGRDR